MHQVTEGGPYQKFYSRFLNAHPDRLHFAAHSHHFWPDVTREAQLKYWDDSAVFCDEKWNVLFDEVFPETRKHIADILGLSQSDSICFAPNTHEFINRILSCFDSKVTHTVLTTDSEFYSFDRQMRRLEESGVWKAIRVPVEPIDTFHARFIEASEQVQPDLIFFSQVFFNSGYVVNDLPRLVARLKSEMIVVDGYHAFCAIPFSLSELETKIFFIGGGYKYAQAGEGICFLHVPPTSRHRPANTGWFAAFQDLESPDGLSRLSYLDNGMRFAGATFDPSGAYRFNAVMRLWKQHGITVEKSHQYVQALQEYFISILDRANIPQLSKRNLIGKGNLENLGHFLTFRLQDAAEWKKRLKARNVIVDSRADRLRFGFGIYHANGQIDRLIDLIKNLPRI